MEEISKKDLLILTGISYGQLYRWKRKGLIPEDWFVKKASFTGQETFFPKDLILERIDKILELKDMMSLEDLSDLLNNNEHKTEISIADLKEKQLFFNQDVFQLYQNETIQFNDIVLLKIVDNIYQLEIDENEIDSFYAFILEHSYQIIHEYKAIYIMTCASKLMSILVKENDSLEYQLNDYLKINLKSLIENIKLIINS